MESVRAEIEAAVAAMYALADRRDTSHADGRLSISSLGKCIRASAYQVAGVPPTDEPSNHPATHLGTWIHRGALPLLRLLLRGSRTEVPVTLTYGGLVLPGRTDLWWRPRRTALDVKTAREYGIQWLRRDGPKASVRAQVSGYALALEQAGAVIDWIAYVYVERGTGATEVVVEPFTDELRQVVVRRLQAIEVAAELPALAEREERGPGLSIVCDGCAWLRACWGPDAVPGSTGPQTQLADGAESVASVLELYATGSAAEGRAKKDKEFARAIVDQTPAGIYGDYQLGWTGGGGGGDAPDPAAMEARLRELGEPIPMKWTGGRKASIRVTLAKAAGQRKKRAR